MTVGQRIQEHRKKNGLSQEELGQRLLVSRQTVSLWEKDQTLPTVDNLLLLKEIFGISVDELLGEEKKETAEAEALEVHTFTYEKEPLRKMYKQQFIGISVLLAVLLGMAVSVFAEGLGLVEGLLSGLLLSASCFMVFCLNQTYGARKSGLARLPATTVTAAVYEEKLVMRSARQGALCSEMHIPFGEIEKVTKDAVFYQLHYGGKAYLIPVSLFKKREFEPTSRLEALLKRLAAARVKEPTTGMWRWISFGLCFLTMLSLPLGTFLSEGVSFLTGEEGIYFWAFYLALPIPLASVAVGVYLLRKKKKAWKNVVLGSLASVLLVLYGSFPLLVNSSWGSANEDIFEVQEIRLGMEFPKIEKWEQTELFESKGNWQSDFISKAFYSEEDSLWFELSLSEDSRWLTELPEEWKNLANEDWSGDYILMYNVTASELNRVPTAEGTHEVTVLSYDRVENSLTVYGYYVKCTSEE